MRYRGGGNWSIDEPREWQGEGKRVIDNNTARQRKHQEHVNAWAHTTTILNDGILLKPMSWTCKKLYMLRWCWWWLCWLCWCYIVLMLLMFCILMNSGISARFRTQWRCCWYVPYYGNCGKRKDKQNSWDFCIINFFMVLCISWQWNIYNKKSIFYVSFNINNINIIQRTKQLWMIGYYKNTLFIFINNWL